MFTVGKEADGVEEMPATALCRAVRSAGAAGPDFCLSRVADGTQVSQDRPGWIWGPRPGTLSPTTASRSPPQYLTCHRATTSTVHDDQPYWDIVRFLDLLLDIGGPATSDDMTCSA